MQTALRATMSQLRLLILSFVIKIYIRTLVDCGIKVQMLHCTFRQYQNRINVPGWGLDTGLTTLFCKKDACHGNGNKGNQHYWMWQASRVITKYLYEWQWWKPKGRHRQEGKDGQRTPDAERWKRNWRPSITPVGPFKRWPGTDKSGVLLLLP